MRDIIVINDILGGCLGEKRVFWNYMLESIPNIHGVDWSVVGQDNFEMRAKQYIDHHFSKDAIIIQNATFISLVDPERFTISFLQDNLRGMGVYNAIQEDTLRRSQRIIANSIHTANSYKEFKTDIIPIGIDEQLFNIKDKETLRIKYGIPLDKKVGIFVGQFNDVKGWNQIKTLAETNTNIYFILVTKNRNDSYVSNNSSVFKVVDQETLSELNNCADFFVLGSPVETQCLAALEANFCNLPVVMNNTGIYMDWEDKDKFGVFGPDFNSSVDFVLNNKFNPREAILNKGLSIEAMNQKWKKVLESI